MTRTRAQDDPGAFLRDRVRHNLASRCRIGAERLLVAISGGSDSVALLRLLVEVRSSFDCELVVAHLDHRLRPDAEKDAQFVRELAAQLGLEVHVGIWDEPRPGEAAARDARHDFLQRTARAHGCTAIVLGHQLDDQIETVLLRLGRGSGPRGLSGMQWRRRADVDIVRPLLDCRREELVTYLRRAGQPWRDDSSNIDLARTRNRVRHLVLPALDAAFGSGWRERWSTAVAEQQELTSWLLHSAQRFLARARRPFPSAPDSRCEALDLEMLRRLAGPRRRAALQVWLDPRGTLGLRRAHVLRASGLVQNGQTGQRLDLPSLTLRIEAPFLVCERREGGDAPARSGGEHGSGTVFLQQTGAETSEPLTFSLEAEPIPPYEALRNVAERRRATARTSVPPLRLPVQAAVVVCADRTSPPLGVRSGRAGERVRLLGAPGSRALRRILQDWRVPARLRRDWPVVADAEGIVWIPGIGIAERCRLDADSSRALRLHLQQAAPTPVRLAEAHDKT